MPRIIFKCPYLKGGSPAVMAHLKNLVGYIATRDGAEKIDPGNTRLAATNKQKELVAQLVQSFPESTELFEYEDYLSAPNRGNASAFITMVIEQNLSQLIHREKYLEYIAKRPRAQRFGTHGLFTGDRDSLVLSQVAEAVAEHPGNVWLPIISLRREDASRLGYDSAENWRSFLSSYAIQMAEAMKIPWEQFRWYAAFHNESHHPHIHMVCYSADPSKSFLTKTGIAQIKSGLAKHIFRQELTALYAQQTRSRDALVQNTCEVMAQLITQMQTGVLENSRIEHLVTVLAQRLRFLSGKKQYGYLKAPLKSLVDEIVDELARDIRVAKAYALWYEQREEVLRTYQEDLPARLPLSQQKEFKKIKNIVIQEALRLGELSQVFLPDEDTVAPEDLPELLCERNGQATEAPPAAAWSKRYKEARQFLYGSDGHPQDQGKALALFRTEALAGNDLAMYALAKLLLVKGEVSQDLSEALRWLRRSAELNNQFAQYRLGRERELRSTRKISDIDNEIARISEQNLVLVRLKSKGYVDSALYLSQMDEIDRKLRELRKLRRHLLEAAGEDRQIHDTERMMEYLEDGPEWLDEVPAELFGELIERIIIISPERLKFRLLNGMELAENIERTVR